MLNTLLGQLHLWSYALLLLILNKVFHCHGFCNDTFCGNHGQCVSLEKSITSSPLTYDKSFNKDFVCYCDVNWQGEKCDSFVCSGRSRSRLSASSGKITPGPNNYVDNSQCAWLLGNGNTSVPIRLRVSKFSIECSWDNLYIHEGMSLQAPLVAVLNGYLTKENLASWPEIVLHSGYAYLYFSSDFAYNLPGFTLSYGISKCPLTCGSSGHGHCDLRGVCICEPGWEGEACLQETCPNNCSKLNGVCVKGVCQCVAEYTGRDCGARRSDGYWMRIFKFSSSASPSPTLPSSSSPSLSPSPPPLLSPPPSPSSPPPPSSSSPPPHLTSAKSVVVGGKLYLIGGYSFQQQKDLVVYVLDLRNRMSGFRILDTSPSTSLPAARLKHAVDVLQNTIYMSGGMLLNNTIVGDLWCLDVVTATWSRVISADQSEMLPVEGHTGHIYNRALYIFFGHNHHYGFLHHVQKFDLVSRRWTLVEGKGARMHGLFGHSSVLDVTTTTATTTTTTTATTTTTSPTPQATTSASNHMRSVLFKRSVVLVANDSVTKTQPTTTATPTTTAAATTTTARVVIIGGLKATTMIYTELLSDRFYTFDLNTLVWTPMRWAGKGRYLHTSVLIGRSIYTYGGNCVTSTATNTLDPVCSTSQLIAYNLDCNTWSLLDGPDVLTTPFNSRHGHTTAVHNATMLVYGGYNGFILNDLIAYTPATCTGLGRGDCLQSLERGINCVYIKGADSSSSGADSSGSSGSSSSGGSGGGGSGGGSGGSGSDGGGSGGDGGGSGGDGGRCVSSEEYVRMVGRKEDVGEVVMAADCSLSSAGTVPPTANDCDLYNDDCMGCVQRGCVMCANVCTLSVQECSSQPILSTTTDCSDDPRNTNITCHSLITCPLCSTNPLCHWADKKCVSAELPEPGNSIDGKDSTATNNNYHIPLQPLDDQDFLPSNHAIKPTTAMIPPTAQGCQDLCYLFDDCYNCTRHNCMWCSSSSKCLDSYTYLALYPYGRCVEWLTDWSKCYVHSCEEMRGCSACIASPSCGFCDDGTGTGSGTCHQGSVLGPYLTSLSSSSSASSSASSSPANGTNAPGRVCGGSNDWYFMRCPACQCNGYSTCYANTATCISCQNFTAGDQCERCVDGYYGHPVRRVPCIPCQCDREATEACNSRSGECYCKSKGAEKDCLECASDHKKIYNDCFQVIHLNFMVNFNITNRYTTRANFLFNATLVDSDVEINITCVPATNVSMFLWKDATNYTLLSKRMVAWLTRRVTKDELRPQNNHQQVHILLYVTDVSWPFFVEVSYYHVDHLDLYKFFITFFSCFFTLLLVAFALWKFRQRIDMMRRTQRHLQEMEEMAKRPCSTCLLLVDDEPAHQPIMDSLMIINALDKSETKLLASKQKKSKMVAVAFEPLSNHKTAVMSIIIRLPHVDEPFTPPSQSGLAFGSTLVTMGHHTRKNNDKQAKKKVPHDMNIEPHLV